MKLKLRLKTLVFTLCFMLVFGNISSAQGLYNNKKTTDTENTMQKSGGPTLRDDGPPGGEPGEPGNEVPVTDALWLLVGLSSIYGVFCYTRKKKQNA